MCKGTLTDIEAIAAGGRFSLAELGTELALAARELAERLELLEGGLMARLDPAEVPNIHDSFNGLKRRAQVFGQAAEFFKRLRVAGV